MDLFQNLALGFSTAAQPANLLYAFFGCLLGTLIGGSALPVTRAHADSLKLPATL